MNAPLESSAVYPCAAQGSSAEGERCCAFLILEGGTTKLLKLWILILVAHKVSHELSLTVLMKKQFLSGTGGVVQLLDWVDEVGLGETLNVCSDLPSCLNMRSRFNG